MPRLLGPARACPLCSVAALNPAPEPDVVEHDVIERGVIERGVPRRVW
ncbi:MAG: hypothetical protein HOP15_10845, partial [Planctomycetes bacterium]|nr:hypothetical protein [Planctomycetota bacterium]